MKVPHSEDDPRYVSAFSVYNGLAKFKSYQDTSNPAATKRNKKSKKRKQKKESAMPATTPKPEQQANKGFKLPEEEKPSDSAINGVTISKRKRQKKKKSKQVSDGHDSLDTKAVSKKSTLTSSYFQEVDIEGPPAKSRKTANSTLVPNPLAIIKKGADLNRKSVGKAKNMPSDLDVGKVVNQKSNKSSTKGSSTDNVNNNSKIKFGKNTSDLQITSTQKKKNGDCSKSLVKAKKVSNKTESSGKVSKSSLVSSVTSNEPPVDIKSILTSARVEDSVEHATQVLDWLLNPVTSEEFMEVNWEKKPLLIKRKHTEAADYYKWILTTQTFDDILRRNTIKYGVNLDITSYVDGKRETLSENMQGRVRPAVVWDYYNNGCSVRMLNPQTYFQPLWRLNSSLQELFCSFVGANMYLTPPDSQGFAPHYDDIDAFILQIEGKKRWKLYGARNEEEKLPRFSSGNFSEETDKLGEPILDVVLEEGDLLYFPRGVIHQAQTVDGEHSLHITLSCNQLNTFGDLLKHHLNHALDKLMAKDINFRKGLPTDYLSFMGIAHKNTTDNELKKKRSSFSKTIEQLVTKIAKEPADFAADLMGKKLVWDSSPPYLNSKERETTVIEDGEFMQNGRVFNRVEFGPETEVKFIRKNCVRLAVEEEQIKLYFSSENAMTYHDDEPQYLELSVESAPAVNHLINQYPNYSKVEDLPITSDDIGQKIQIVSDLWERGLLFTESPLEPCDYDDFASENSETDDKTSNAEEDEVESVNLSDLPEDNDDDDEEDDDFTDDFYDTTVGFDSDNSEDDEDVDETIFEDEGGDSDDENDDVVYGIDEESEDDFSEEEDDDEEIDIDELDRMEESDENA